MSCCIASNSYRIDQSLRKGRPTEIQLDQFEEALHDVTSVHCSFWYYACYYVLLQHLLGDRKQSVEDVGLADH